MRGLISKKNTLSWIEWRESVGERPPSNSPKMGGRPQESRREVEFFFFFGCRAQARRLLKRRDSLGKGFSLGERNEIPFRYVCFFLVIGLCFQWISSI